jgi:hypothetical protein
MNGVVKDVQEQEKQVVPVVVVPDGKNAMVVVTVQVR